jgi:uncharacterized protein
MSRVWRNRILGAASVAAIVYASFAAYFSINERAILYRPNPQYVTPQGLGLTNIEEVKLKTSDGLTILAWVARPRGDAPMIVYFHGNGGSFQRLYGRIQKLNSFGYGVAMLGYRGYSGSDGAPTEDGLYTDGRALMDWLNAQGYADRDLAIYGQSLGSGVATKMAAERRVAAVVLEAPYTSIPDVAAKFLPYFPLDLLVRDQFRSIDRIAAIGAPLLIVHGGRDSVVPQDMGRALLAAAREPKQGYFPPDADHLDAHLHGSYPVIRNFLARYARGPAP